MKTLQKLILCFSHCTLHLPKKLISFRNILYLIYRRILWTLNILLLWSEDNKRTPTGMTFTVTLDTLCSLEWAAEQTSHSQLENCQTWVMQCHPQGCGRQWPTFPLFGSLQLLRVALRSGSGCCLVWFPCRWRAGLGTSWTGQKPSELKSWSKLETGLKWFANIKF